MEGIQGCRTRGLEGDEADIIRRFEAGLPRNDKHTLYTDATWKKERAGIAVVQGGSGKLITQKAIPDWAADDSTVAELIAIHSLESLLPSKATTTGYLWISTPTHPWIHGYPSSAITDTVVFVVGAL
jgi:hypothetical protein